MTQETPTQISKPMHYTPADIRRMDLVQVIQVAQQLRYVSDAAEQSFIGYLMMVEENADWRPAGATFEAFLTNNSICEPRRYSVGKLAIQTIEQPVRAKIGMKASMAVMRIEDPAHRYDCLQTMIGTAEQNGAPLSDRHARNIVKTYVTVPARVRQSSSEMRQLKADNARLRDENKKLVDENDALRAEVTSLKAALPERA